MRKFISFCKEVWQWSVHDNLSLHAAALSFFAIFSFLPLLIIAYILFELFSTRIFFELLFRTSETLGSEAANLFLGLVQDIALETFPWWFIVLGVIVILATTSQFIYFLQKSMNKIWNVRSRGSWFSLELRHRAFALTSVFFLLLLLVVLSLRNVLLFELSKMLGAFAGFFFFLLSGALLFLIMVVFYRVLPDRTIPFKDVLYGSIFATVAFWLGYLVLQQVFAFSFIGTIYAAISGVLLVLLWFFYFAFVLYLGAQICKVYSLRYGCLKPYRTKFYKSRDFF